MKVNVILTTRDRTTEEIVDVPEPLVPNVLIKVGDIVATIVSVTLPARGPNTGTTHVRAIERDLYERAQRYCREHKAPFTNCDCAWDVE